LLLIENVQINIGVIWHFVLSFSYLVYYRKCWNLTLRITLISQFMVTINPVFMLRKSVHYSVNYCSN